MTVAEKWDYLLDQSTQRRISKYANARRSVFPSAWSHEDVMQEAVCWAAEKWDHDPEKSKPQTYATVLGRLGVVNACTHRDPDEPAHRKAARRRVAAFRRRFEREHGRAPSMGEIPKALFDGAETSPHLAMEKPRRVGMDWVNGMTPEPLRDMDAGAEIEEAVDAALLYARVCAALDTMPPENRHAIVEHIMEERAQPDIGRECGVSRTTVQNRIKVGLEYIRARVKA